jgi:hypothetical protein
MTGDRNDREIFGRDEIDRESFRPGNFQDQDALLKRHLLTGRGRGIVKRRTGVGPGKNLRMEDM